MASAMDDIWVHSGSDDIHCCVRGPRAYSTLFLQTRMWLSWMLLQWKAVKVSVFFMWSLCDSFCNVLYMFAQKLISRTSISGPCIVSLSCRPLFINLIHFQSSNDVLLVFGQILEFLSGSVQICRDSHGNFFLPKLQLGDMFTFCSTF